MAEQKKKFGYMPCPDRGDKNCAAAAYKVPVKINAKGTLSWTCPECDSSGYVKQGAGNYSAVVGRIDKLPGAGEPPREEPPKPTAKKPLDIL